MMLTVLLTRSSNAQAPANDLCTNAILLTSGATCTPITGTVNNATQTGTITGGCGTSIYDVWYKFTAQSKNPIISLSAIGAGFVDPRIQILGGTCGSMTAVTGGCNTAALVEASALNLTVGTTYFVRLYSLTGPVPTTGGDFDICITDPPAPVNDLYTGAITLTSGAACAAISGSMANSNASTGDPAFNTPTAYDVWYTFTAQSVNPIITLSNIGINFSGPRIQVLQGTYGTLTNKYNNTAAIVATTPLGLTIGTTYYVRLYSTVATPIPANTAGFDICITDPPIPTNDLYTGAINLVSGAACTITSGSMANSNATTTGDAAIGTPGAYDVWYTFTAQSVNPLITLNNVGANFPAPKIQVLQGTFGTLISKFNNTPAVAATTAMGLTIGTTYYLRVYPTTATIIPANTAGFDICITDPPVPANDLYTGAINITSGATCTITSGSMANSSASPGDMVLISPTGYDLWYTFTAQSTNPVITLNNIGSNFGTSNARVQVLEGTFGSLVSKFSGNATQALTGSYNLTIGNTYYLRISSIGTASPANTAGFDFCITETYPPANDLYTNAINLISGATCSNTAGTIVNSIPTSGDAAILIPSASDVWYTFTAQTINPKIALSTIGFTNPRIQVLEGTFGSLISRFDNTTTFALTAALNLVPGNTYYVRVYSGTLPSTSPAVNAAFDICITDPLPPVNDLYTNATNLVSGASCVVTSGNLANASATSGDAAINTPTGYDVWYTFTAQSTNPVINVSSVGLSVGGTARVQVFEGTFGTFTSKFANTPATLLTAPLTLTIGNTYYIRVYSTNATPIPAAAAGFNICITETYPPANDLYTNAINLVSGSTCTVTAGTMVNAVATSGDPALVAPGGYDVWYTFTAQSFNPVITVNGVTANFANPAVQVLGGSFGTFTSMFSGTAATLLLSPLMLTVGNTYYIRVYSTSSTPIPATNASFNICITDQTVPVNDAIAGAITLTSNIGCVNSPFNIGNSSYNIADGAVGCAGTDFYDVWFKFVAQRVNPTITISSFNNTYFNSPKVQIFSGVPGSLVSVGCSGTPAVLNAYTTGQTYYVRVYSNTGSGAPPNFNSGTFNICINDPVLPLNEDCVTATMLTQNVNGTCSNTGGNLTNALPSASAIPGDCGNASSPDLWYSFVATTPYPQISVTGAGASLAAAGLRVQLFSGTCGSLTSVICNRAVGNSLTTYPPGAGLIPGQTYFVRVYSNGGAPTNIAWNYNICITTPAAPLIHYGKTYANVTKGANGGTIEPGDVLEMRAILNIRTNVALNAVFTDNIPANTTYVPGTLRILTNEGKIFRQWTDASDADPASITGSSVLINLGSGADATTGGSVQSADRPTTSGQCIMMVSFSVQVNAVPYGTTIQMGGGTVAYNLPDATPVLIAYSPTPATVYQNYGICTNTIGTNGILSEFGGTFGSGTLKDRVASNKVPANYTFTNFTSGNPGDYKYGVSNNTSSSIAPAEYSIDPNETATARRVFGVWDVIGDHTGALNPLTGNLPADVVGGATGGYMVVINAAYRADTAFQDTVRNLCSNTSYEYSAWFRNICSKCGVDSAGVGPGTVGYVPTGPGDTSGVHPNLTFNINGSDYYTTGDMAYTGQWVKKGFTYRTGPGETEMIINIRNNAPGGGGNDWAIDDIGVATCSPSLVMNPATPVVNVCYGDGQSMAASVVSFYDNFTHWIWEKSVDSGTTWTSTGYFGNTTPVYNGTEYEYTATGPSIIGDSSTHKNLFRLRVASTSSNLADIDCSFRAIRTIQVMVANCMHVLRTNVITVNGILRNSYGVIDWTSTDEEAGVLYTVEKSFDGVNFKTIGSVKGKATKGLGEKYQFTDPVIVKSPAFYRIAISENGHSKYSKTILLSPVTVDFDVKNLVNPFNAQLSFDVIAPAEGMIRVSILDNFGRVVRTFNQIVYKGVTPIRISEHGALSNGVYGLKIVYGNASIVKRLVKLNK